MKRLMNRNAFGFVSICFAVVTVGLFGACGDDDPVTPSPGGGGTKPFTVVSVSPVDSATNVDVNTSRLPAGIVITFSDNVDRATIGSISLSPHPDPGFAVAMMVNGAVVTLSYNRALGPATVYTVAVTAGLKSTSGDSLTTEFTSVFTTGSSFPTGPPILFERTRGPDPALSGHWPSSFNHGGGGAKYADNFQLTNASTVTHIEWTAISQDAATQFLFGIVVNWFVEVWSAQPGNPGAPASLIRSQSFPLASTNEVRLGDSYSCYSVTLANPVSLSASTTYWIGINADLGGVVRAVGPTWATHQTDGGGSVGDLSITNDIGGDGTWDGVLFLGDVGQNLVFTLRGTVP